MIRKGYGVDCVRLELSDQAVVFGSPAVDMLTASGSHRTAQPS